MGIANAASSASSGPAPYVIGRQLVFNGVVIEVEVPRNAEESFVILDGKKRACRKFIRPVKGGHVPVYVHSLTEKCVAQGKKIAALLTVWEELLSDHRSFLALHLIETDKLPTHSWRVVQLAGNQLSERFRLNGINFPVPAPLQGFIILMPLKPGGTFPSRYVLNSRWTFVR